MIYIHETNSGILASSLLEYNRFILDDLDDTTETYSDRSDSQSWQVQFKDPITSAWIIVAPVKDDLDDKVETYISHFDWQSWQSRFKNLITSACIIVGPVEDDLDDKIETYSDRSDSQFLSLSVQSLITPAWGAVRQVEDEQVADEARRILSIIAETVLISQKRGVDLEHLPHLHAFDVQDGSILIEWIFDDFRVGFSIEPIPSESSWYLVSNAKLGDIGESGYISQDESETQTLMLRLLNFVMSHV